MSLAVVLFSVGVALLSVIVGLQVAPLMSWVERKQMALIQRRVGPNRVGLFKWRLFGLGQPLADALKLLYKEDFIPKHVIPFWYVLAPIIPVIMGLTSTLAIPWAGKVLVDGHYLPVQAVNLNGGFLFVFAISALTVYGVALAGWASNNKYSLLGGLRASAQMISYEGAMGLSLIPIVFIYGSLDLQTIIQGQTGTLFGVLPNWGVFYAPVSFVIFLVCVFAETNRLPFDLAEGEAELVAGFLTEYGAMRWSLFFLGEYAMLFTLSAVTVALYFGGYELPWLSSATISSWLQPHVGEVTALALTAVVGFTTMFLKVCLLIWFFVQVRFTIPRFRYDQLMKLGWMVLLPLSIANIAVTAILAACFKFHG